MTVTPAGPVFRVRDIPFSYHGSWFNLSPVIAERTYAEDLHLVSHQTGMHPVLRLLPTVAGERADCAVHATSALLTWDHAAGRIEAAYENPDTLRVRGHGLGLRILAANPRLTPFSGPYLYHEPVAGAPVFTLYETGRRYRITNLSQGRAETLEAETLGAADRGVVLPGGQPWELVIEEYQTARAPYAKHVSFEQVVAAAQAQFGGFLQAVAPWRSARTPAAALAAYVLWSATVRPAGFLRRPAVLMSKHWMDKVWSWDHCFNALALAPGLPQLAADQFQVVFDHQDPTGALPDSVTHSEVLYNFVKPPIHGWALGRLRRLAPGAFDRTTLIEAYRRLSAWTGFWLTHRRAPGDPLPYYQHGNDSGWDNASTFDPARVVQTADLAALLILQLRELAAIAAELGEPAAAERWSRTAEEVRAAMLDRLWDGTRFCARGAVSGEAWPSSSLLDLMPIVLGAGLPQPVHAALAQRIQGHLTSYGLATELTSSPRYEEDGYWRGPIWAPATVLAEYGLRDAGYDELADTVSERFRVLCERSGFAENFNAGTGAALRDRAYTWTASAYLMLAAEHEQRLAAQPAHAAEPLSATR